MLKTARVSCAGVYATAGIDTELKPFRVNIVTDSLHAVRKLFRIRHKMPLTVSLFSAPAIINDDIFIAGIMKSRIHHRVCCGDNQFL